MKFIGCDVGGSGSCAVLVSANGEIVHAVHGPAANPYILGFDASVKIIVDLLRRTLCADTHELRAVTVCISGADSTQVCGRYETELFTKLQLSSKSRVIVVHDVVAPLGLIMSRTACTQRMVVLIAGTGSVAALFGMNKKEANRSISSSSSDAVIEMECGYVQLLRRAGGWGPLLGDGGSAWWIAQRALSYALQLRDGMQLDGIETVQGMMEWGKQVLDKAVQHYCGNAAAVEQLVAFVHDARRRRAEIASLAPTLARLAENGNALCCKVFYEAGMEVAKLLLAVLAEEQEHDQVSVCATGGVFAAWHQVEQFRRGFWKVANGYQRSQLHVNMLEHDGQRNREERMAVGCARLGAFATGSRSMQWEGELKTWVKQV